MADKMDSFFDTSVVIHYGSFSKSVDNPDSLLGQLKRMEINAEKAKADEKINAAKALKEFRTPMYAGHSGLSAPNVASFD